MTPLMLRTAALEVAKGALVHPFFRVRLVNDVAALANWAPSSEVKHWALEKFPACTVTTPLVAMHRSTGMKTFLAGRKASGRVNGTALVPLVAIAPLKWTIPETLVTAALEVPKGALVQPFLRVSGVSALTLVACAAPAPRMGRMTAVAH